MAAVGAAVCVLCGLVSLLLGLNFRKRRLYHIIRLCARDRIPADHCFYTLDTAEKPALAERIVREHFGDFPPGKVVCVDDNDDTLAMYMKQTDFCTAHPMIFMENV